VAAAIKGAVNLDADIVEGSRGEFTVWVGDRVIARKGAGGFPSDDEIVAAVREAVKREPSST
jgi:predicted Rdx family selenoprotein